MTILQVENRKVEAEKEGWVDNQWFKFNLTHVSKLGIMKILNSQN